MRLGSKSRQTVSCYSPRVSSPKIKVPQACWDWGTFLTFQCVQRIARKHSAASPVLTLTGAMFSGQQNPDTRLSASMVRKAHDLSLGHERSAIRDIDIAIRAERH